MALATFVEMHYKIFNIFIGLVISAGLVTFVPVNLAVRLSHGHISSCTT